MTTGAVASERLQENSRASIRNGDKQDRSADTAFKELVAWAAGRHADGHGLEDLFKQIRQRGWSAHESFIALLRALPPDQHKRLLELETGTGEALQRQDPAFEELVTWAASAHEDGYAAAQIFNRIRADEWSVDEAVAALVRALPAEQHEHVRRLRRLAPDPDFSRAPGGSITIDGHTVHVLCELRNPRVVVFGNLLAPQECEELIGSAGSRLRRSAVTGDGEDTIVSTARTSSGMFFERGETALCARIEARIAALVDWPEAYTEAMQVLRYGKEQEYEPHHDFFEPPEGHWAPVFRRGGQRVGSLVIYLNTPTIGGSTVFPEIPLEVRAIAGNAVFFAYDKADASSRTLHGGAPVGEGEKWAAVKWFRQGPFD